MQPKKFKNRKKKHRGLLNGITRWKKPKWKDYTLYDSNYMTFWKRQNYGDSKKISSCLGLREMTRQNIKHFSVQFPRTVVSDSLRPPQTAACQASLSITNSQSLPKPMPIELVMPSNHLILCHPLLLLPSIFLSIRVFSNESALRIRQPKYWSFSSTSVPPMNTQDWSSLGWTGWISLESKGLSRVFSNTTVQKH